MKIFLAFVALVLVTVAVRLAYLQIIHGQEYRDKAERALLLRPEPMAAMRGKILDRNGKILACDEPCFDLCVEYQFLAQTPKWVRRQKAQLAQDGIPKDELDQVYAERSLRTREIIRQTGEALGVDTQARLDTIMTQVDKRRQRVGMRVEEELAAHPVIRGMEEAVALKLRDALSESVGLVLRPSCKRKYPYGALACHIIGVTGQVSEEEQDEHNLPAEEVAGPSQRLTRDYLDGDMIGKSGVEKMCEMTGSGDPLLRGVRGYRRLKRTGEVVEEAQPQAGLDVTLTIDIELQRRLTELMAGKGLTGCIVVIDVKTGELLAMVSAPTYDLNDYYRNYETLSKNEIELPLLHRAVARLYPPGSTVKPVTGLAGMGEKVIAPGTPITCLGYLHNKDSFRCWIWKKSQTGHGPQRLEEAIMHSCNVFFYECGDRLGLGRLAEWQSKFGFSDVPGTGLPEERPGLVPDGKWLRKRFNRDAQPGDARFAAIGQGLMLATPLHVANEMATIARGTFYSPVIARDIGQLQARRELPLTQDQFDVVRLGMRRVVNDPGGTARSVFHDGADDYLPILVCGKTGTATTPPLRVDSNNNGFIDREDEIVREGDTAWFAGFAPYGHPQVAFAVVVEYVKEGGGASNAGPIARRALQICREMGYLN